MPAKPLIPADPLRCQAEISNGVNFMTLGGRKEMIRCNNRPAVIATEKQPGPDGQHGSMSLCTSCMVQFLKQSPADYASFEEVKEA